MFGSFDMHIKTKMKTKLSEQMKTRFMDNASFSCYARQKCYYIYVGSDMNEMLFEDAYMQLWLHCKLEVVMQFSWKINDIIE